MADIIDYLISKGYTLRKQQPNFRVGIGSTEKSDNDLSKEPEWKEYISAVTDLSNKNGSEITRSDGSKGYIAEPNKWTDPVIRFIVRKLNDQGYKLANKHIAGTGTVYIDFTNDSNNTVKFRISDHLANNARSNGEISVMSFSDAYWYFDKDRNKKLEEYYEPLSSVQIQDGSGYEGKRYSKKGFNNIEENYILGKVEKETNFISSKGNNINQVTFQRYRVHTVYKPAMYDPRNMFAQLNKSWPKSI